VEAPVIEPVAPEMILKESCEGICGRMTGMPAVVVAPQRVRVREEAGGPSNLGEEEGQNEDHVHSLAAEPSKEEAARTRRKLLGDILGCNESGVGDMTSSEEVAAAVEGNELVEVEEGKNRHSAAAEDEVNDQLRSGMRVERDMSMLVPMGEHILL
jgi:hypothetical protein